MLPVTRMRSAVTPSERRRSACSSVCTAKRSSSASTRGISRVRACMRYDLADILPFTTTTVAPRAARAADEVRPELGLHDDHEPRREAPQEAAHDPRQVERKRHDAVARIELAGRGETRRGERGNHERRTGEVALEQRDERLQQRDLTGGGTVQPDAAVEPAAEPNTQAHREIAAIPVRTRAGTGATARAECTRGDTRNRAGAPSTILSASAAGFYSSRSSGFGAGAPDLRDRHPRWSPSRDSGPAIRARGRHASAAR